MMVYIGLMFFSAPSPSLGMALRSRSQIFHTNVKGFAYIIKIPIDFTGICYSDNYRSKVLFSMIPAPITFEIKVMGFT